MPSLLYSLAQPPVGASEEVHHPRREREHLFAVFEDAVDIECKSEFAGCRHRRGWISVSSVFLIEWTSRRVELGNGL